jgi:hypothetical protein
VRDLHKKIAPLPAVLGLAGSLIVAALFSLAVWDGKYPRIYVDNASDHAMQLWVDGRPLKSVPPNLDGSHPATARVSRGKHRLGYSALGAQAPEEEIEADVLFGYRDLYNPGARGCYWRRVVLYKEEMGGSRYREHHDRAPLSQDGPLAIQQFYELPDIQYWFENPPPREHFGQSDQGFWRVALLRSPTCTDLGKQGCSLGVRQRLVSCQVTAHSEADLERCRARAKAACDAKASTM